MVPAITVHRSYAILNYIEIIHPLRTYAFLPINQLFNKY